VWASAFVRKVSVPMFSKELRTNVAAVASNQGTDGIFAEDRQKEVRAAVPTGIRPDTTPISCGSKAFVAK